MIKMELFVLLLFGHLFGDYLFQNDWMALGKKDDWMRCLVHCLIYTLTVIIFLMPLVYNFDILRAGLLTVGIFLSHLVLDKTYLIDRWFRLTKGRTWERMDGFYPKRDKEIEDMARVAFTAIVQTVADNTIHLVLMYFLCYFLI